MGTYQERIAQAQASSVKGKKKKDDQEASVSTDTRITRSVQIKKELEPKVYTKKPTATRKRGKHIILQDKSEEEKKKLKGIGKKSKPVGEILKPNMPIDIASFKLMSHFERTLKKLKRKEFSNVKVSFDYFDEIQKQEVVHEVIN